MSNLPKGALGERLAADYLFKQGYKIICRNFRVRYGEIDLVAIHRKILIFVEVKTRWGTPYGRPDEAVTPWKLRSVIKTAEYFKLLHPNFPDAMQIDVVGVQLDYRGKLVSIAHLPNVTS